MFTIDLEFITVFDFIILLICSFLLLRHGRLGHSHPATLYLFFHFVVVSTRLYTISSGAPTFFEDWGIGFEAVTEEELIRAAFIADIVLCIMTLAWLRASIDDLRRHRDKKVEFRENETDNNLSLDHIWLVAIPTLMIGILGLYYFSRAPGQEIARADFGGWEQSIWLRGTITWFGLGLIALIYWYGFRKKFTIPMLLFLLLIAIQGYHRFRLIIPAILLIQIYLDQNSKRWPSKRIVLLLVIGSLLFLPLKEVGRMIQRGASISEIQQRSEEIIRLSLTGEGTESSLLDQFASGLTLTDRAGKFYMFETYLPLITLPIPRPLWPDKPGIAFYLHEISTPSRPMAEVGSIITFIGESYISFGLLGVILIPYVLAYWLGRLYFRAYRRGYYTIQRMSYLLISANLILVYRDGLTSLVIFTTVYMMPLVIIILLHVFVKVDKTRSRMWHLRGNSYSHKRSMDHNVS